MRALVDVDETWGLTAFRALKAARKQLAAELVIAIVLFPQEGLTPKVANLLREGASDGADAIGAHTDIDKDFESHLKLAASIARDHKLSLEVHVDEGASPASFRLPAVLDGCRDVARLSLVHCLSLGTLPAKEQEHWVGQIRDSGAGVVVAPSILGFGLPLPPVAMLVEAGVPISVGSDNLQDVFMPLGTGRILDSARTVALVGQLKSSSEVQALVQGITAEAYQLVTGKPAALQPGSSASMMVFEGKDARAVMYGADAIKLSVLEGKVQEGSI
ncbi:MAG: hypothetical protein WKH97_12945 [Casimicrobiaceae bacterium]